MDARTTPVKPTTHMRVSPESKAALRAVAAFKGVSIAEVVDEIVIPQLPNLMFGRKAGSQKSSG